MKLANPKLVLGLVTAAALVMGILVGTISERRVLLGWRRVELNNVQGMLAFNRLEADRELKSFLANGCVSEAEKLVNIAEDKDMELIARSYLSRQIDADAIKYMSSRDSNILEELKAFKSRYGPAWSVPKCKS